MCCPQSDTHNHPKNTNDQISNHESNRFIYLNDDYFMLKPICPNDFISEKDELRIYLKDRRDLTEYATQKKYDWKCKCGATLLRLGIDIFSELTLKGVPH